MAAQAKPGVLVTRQRRQRAAQRRASRRCGAGARGVGDVRACWRRAPGQPVTAPPRRAQACDGTGLGMRAGRSLSACPVAASMHSANAAHAARRHHHATSPPPTTRPSDCRRGFSLGGACRPGRRARLVGRGRRASPRPGRRCRAGAGRHGGWPMVPAAGLRRGPGGPRGAGAGGAARARRAGNGGRPGGVACAGADGRLAGRRALRG